MNISPGHPYSKLRLELKDDYIEKEEEEEKDIIKTEKNTIYEDQYDYDIQKPKSRCKRFLLCFSKSNIN